MGNLSKKKKVPLYIKRMNQPLPHSKLIRQQAEEALKQSPGHISKIFVRNLDLIAAKKQPLPYFQQVFFQIEYAYGQLPVKGNKRDTYMGLLKQLHRQKCYDLLTNSEYLTACLTLAECESHWIRQPVQWVRKSRNPHKQFVELVSHLFVQYRVPAFFYSVWLRTNAKHQAWFIQLATGASVKALEKMPIKLTKKMAHCFMQAPDALTVEEALRYAQVVGQGGSESLAWAICLSFLGRNGFAQEVFWAEAIQFFVQADPFDYRELVDVLDYLQAQYQQNPDYSFKGRTTRALLRQAAEWHRQMSRFAPEVEILTWESCGVREIEWEEVSNEVVLKKICIQELLSSTSLIAEGAKQRHCVANYAHSCLKKQIAIFAMFTDLFGLKMAMVTIELNLQNRTIVQVRGKMNRSMNMQEWIWLQKWAAQENLKISKWVAENAV